MERADAVLVEAGVDVGRVGQEHLDAGGVVADGGAEERRRQVLVVEHVHLQDIITISLTYRNVTQPISHLSFYHIEFLARKQSTKKNLPVLSCVAESVSQRAKLMPRGRFLSTVRVSAWLSLSHCPSGK